MENKTTLETIARSLNMADLTEAYWRVSDVWVGDDLSDDVDSICERASISKEDLHSLMNLTMEECEEMLPDLFN